MKRFMLAALTVAMVAINPAASADPGSNGGGRGGGGGSYHGGGNHGGNGGGSYHGGGNNRGNGGGSYHGGGNGGGSYHGGGYPGGGHGPVYPPPKSAYPSQKAYRQARFNYPSYPAPYYRPYYRPHYPAPYYGRAYYPRPVGYPAYYGYPYYGNHHNNNNNSDWPAYLIGGAVLGSVLTNVYHNSQVQAVPAQQVVVAPQQGRRLLRDLNGNCYDRSTDANGNELRTELPPSACNW